MNVDQSTVFSKYLIIVDWAVEAIEEFCLVRVRAPVKRLRGGAYRHKEESSILTCDKSIDGDEEFGYLGY